jgi:hypothetical protein
MPAADMIRTTTTTHSVKEDGSRPRKRSSSTFLSKLWSLKEINNNASHSNSTTKQSNPAADKTDHSDDFDNVNDTPTNIDAITDSSKTLDLAPSSTTARSPSAPLQIPISTRKRMTAQSTSQYHQMVAQEISKRIQSVILPNSNPKFKSDSRPDSVIGHQIGGTARRKSFYIGDPDGDMDNSDPDNNPSNNDDNDDEEEDEEEDFWSLPMGEPVRPFVAGNKFTRAKISSPKVPDLGTVKEEEEDEEEQGGRTGQEVESKEGSYFPTVPRVS